VACSPADDTKHPAGHSDSEDTRVGAEAPHTFPWRAILECLCEHSHVLLEPFGRHVASMVRTLSVEIDGVRLELFVQNHLGIGQASMGSGCWCPGRDPGAPGLNLTTWRLYSIEGVKQFPALLHSDPTGQKLKRWWHVENGNSRRKECLSMTPTSRRISGRLAELELPFLGPGWKRSPY